MPAAIDWTGHRLATEVAQRAGQYLSKYIRTASAADIGKPDLHQPLVSLLCRIIEVAQESAYLSPTTITKLLIFARWDLEVYASQGIAYCLYLTAAGVPGPRESWADLPPAAPLRPKPRAAPDSTPIVAFAQQKAH